tara:strand:- start:3908 stop:4195 length:288 start_codon:yes stop_codon:yes gene_type:complete
MPDHKHTPDWSTVRPSEGYSDAVLVDCESCDWNNQIFLTVDPHGWDEDKPKPEIIHYVGEAHEYSICGQKLIDLKQISSEWQIVTCDMCSVLLND